MTDDWFARANPADLDALARAFESSLLPRGGETLAAVQRLGVAHAPELLDTLRAMPGADGRAAGWFLRRLAAERRAAHDTHAATARLVWSGPHDAHQPLRDTRAVLDELFARAEDRVLVSTFVIYDGRRTLAALAERMRERPSLTVDLYVDLKGDDAASAVSQWLWRFEREHWPEGTRRPSIWYSPSTLSRSLGTTLHAKCVVVDDRWAFVTSANFTGAAQERNFEVGVLLDHRALALALAAQFHGLRDRGVFRAM